MTKSCLWQPAPGCDRGARSADGDSSGRRASPHSKPCHGVPERGAAYRFGNAKRRHDAGLRIFRLQFGARLHLKVSSHPRQIFYGRF
jgi:hypothetical protein